MRAVPSRHHDIADDLRHQITTGRIKPGERLPSESGLADQYKVSTATLRGALAVLQGEGRVEKIHGKGNFIRRPLRKIMYVGGWGTLDPWTAAEAALRVTDRATAIEARGHLAALLRVPNGTQRITAPPVVGSRRQALLPEHRRQGRRHVPPGRQHRSGATRDCGRTPEVGRGDPRRGAGGPGGLATPGEGTGRSPARRAPCSN